MNFQTCPITATSEYAAAFLEGHPMHGTVHSVYRKTINLSLEGELLALQAARSPLSPISLITGLSGGEMADLELCPGAPVLVQERSVLLSGTYRFDLKTASRKNLKLSAGLTEKECAQLQKNIHSALEKREAGSFELLFTDTKRAEEIPFLSIAGKRFRETVLFLEKNCWESGADALRRLIGLGLGLTPGGDDFLCGVLAGLIFAGKTAHPFFRALCMQIDRHLTDTNDISAAFLVCALKSQFSLAVNRLPQLSSPDKILSVFCEIGHSSGTDTLCGILFALENSRLLT